MSWTYSSSHMSPRTSRGHGGDRAGARGERSAEIQRNAYVILYGPWSQSVEAKKLYPCKFDQTSELEISKVLYGCVPVKNPDFASCKNFSNPVSWIDRYSNLPRHPGLQNLRCADLESFNTGFFWSGLIWSARWGLVGRMSEKLTKNMGLCGPCSSSRSSGAQAHREKNHVPRDPTRRVVAEWCKPSFWNLKIYSNPE